MTHTGVRKTKFACGPLFLLALVVGVMAMPAQADAAGLLDWLFPGRAERVARRWSRATQAYRPVTTAGYAGSGTGYTGANTSYYGGNFAGGQNFGSGGYYPSYGSWNGWGYQTNASNYYSTYRPTTVYRTQWSPVPVTTYSPTAGGAYQQPCTGYEWQAQRVPYTAYQPSAVAAAVGGCSSCGCGNRGAAATTARYGGWQPVAPAATAVAAPASTTTGYAPRVDYSQATPWTSAQSVAATTAGSSEWQTVPPNEPRRTFKNQATADDQDAAGATPWRRVGAAEERESAPANRAPRLEDAPSRRTSYLDDSRMEFERERDAYARQREALRRKELELDEMLQRQRERENEESRRRNDSSYDSGLDRFSDWDRRANNRDGRGYGSANRFEEWQSGERTPRSTTYRPSSQTSQMDRDRSEFYRRATSEDRSASRPMLDDDWSYDKTDRRRETGSRYEWRSTSNDRPTYSTRTQAVPASMPNHRPGTGGTTSRGVMPLLLRPIPESNDNWNTQKSARTSAQDPVSAQRAPKLLGPRDRTASLPTSDRWQALAADAAPAKLQWHSVRGN